MKKIVRLAQNLLPTWVKKPILKIANLAITALPGEIDIELIGLKYGTDKLSHGYLRHYDAHFATLRKNQLKLLEIGIGGYHDIQDGGASLRLWQDYFPRGQVYGMDIHDKSFHNSDRISTFIGSQNDPSFLNTLISKIGKLDIIIDDGSHINEHIITSFKTLFPHLNHGGIYVIEDINTAYLPSYGGSFTDLTSETTAIGLIKNLVDSLNYQYIPNRLPTPYDGEILSIHCYPKIIFIMKGVNKNILSTSEAHMIETA